MIIVAATARKSALEYTQVFFRIEKSTSDNTATIMVAASVALGRKKIKGRSRTVMQYKVLRPCKRPLPVYLLQHQN